MGSAAKAEVEMALTTDPASEAFSASSRRAWSAGARIAGRSLPSGAATRCGRFFFGFRPRDPQEPYPATSAGVERRTVLPKGRRSAGEDADQPLDRLSRPAATLARSRLWATADT
jgi:hypothetical protein